MMYITAKHILTTRLIQLMATLNTFGLKPNIGLKEIACNIRSNI